MMEEKLLHPRRNTPHQDPPEIHRDLAKTKSSNPLFISNIKVSINYPKLKPLRINILGLTPLLSIVCLV
jgi:hypothetical protein